VGDYHTAFAIARTLIENFFRFHDSSILPTTQCALTQDTLAIAIPQHQFPETDGRGTNKPNLVTPGY
jgi:hypothetical protein